jgi:hypothetical protein
MYLDVSDTNAASESRRDLWNVIGIVTTNGWVQRTIAFLLKIAGEKLQLRVGNVLSARGNLKLRGMRAIVAMCGREKRKQLI